MKRHTFHNPKSETYPVTTTTKSIMFQTLRRYAPLCNTNPKATIFNNASTQNIPKKYTSVSSCNQKDIAISRKRITDCNNIIKQLVEDVFQSDFTSL